MSGWDDRAEERDDDRTREAERLVRDGGMVTVRNILDDLHVAKAEVKRLNDLLREGVLPMGLDDGSHLYASAVSGGADYADGMPRQVRLVACDAEGNEIERQYVQTPKLGAVCRIVFLHGKENRDSVVYREAAEELARIGLVPT